MNGRCFQDATEKITRPHHELRAIPRFAAEPLMRIQGVDAVRDSVVYIGVEANGRFTPLGTGFLISRRYGLTHVFIFAVTAAHVVKSIAGDTVYVRLNRKSGDAASIAIRSKSIVEWEDNDLALIPLDIGGDVYDYKMLEIDEAVLGKARETFDGISYGDEVYAIGLYTSHYGLTRNIPVVRTGHVALLPGEPVRGPTGYLPAYLVELRTIAGLSGSPVFLNPPIVRVKNKILEGMTATYYIPIGVLLGYHVVETKEDQVLVSKFQTTGSDDGPNDTDSLDQRNTGFGVVVPIDRILDMLNSKFIQESMKAGIEKHTKESGFRPASALPPSAPDEKPTNPTHREDFKRLLDAAVKPLKSSDQT
jgi:Trypsin-like peptidase domain